ncbi:MAG: ABC transporter substrate-binding protein [Lachnospiraceae bacterium]|nr:ABC transporter substrate-binding protein [Lachnospiraceae bacterium]
MKKKIIFAALLTAFVALSLSACKSQAKDSITVFNYSMYIDPEILDQFEEESGIHVNYEEAPTPEELYTKYKSGAISYDLLCSSEYMLQRLMSEGELKEVDFSSFENKDNMSSRCMEMCKDIDPEHKYLMPYFWGTVGILYDPDKTNGEITSWDSLFNGEYSGNFIMQDSMRDSFMVALKYLGYSANTTDEAELLEAKELLISQKPQVQAYHVDEVRDEIIGGNAALGVIYSGEGYYAYQENDRLKYCIPKEGSNYWIDCFCMTKDCKNVEGAKKFMDFLCREDIAQKNFDYVCYSSAMNSVVDNYSDAEKNFPAVNPSDEELKRCEMFKQLPKETTEKMGEYWKELKAR